MNSGWQATVGPTSAKSADLATNSQRRSNGGMLSGLFMEYGNLHGAAILNSLSLNKPVRDSDLWFSFCLFFFLFCGSKTACKQYMLIIVSVDPHFNKIVPYLGLMCKYLQQPPKIPLTRITRILFLCLKLLNS